jgi:hypothetical protein
MTMALPRTARRAGSLTVCSMLLAISATAQSPQQPPAPGEFVTDAPADCPGTAMTVMGEVTNVFGPRLFTIAASGTHEETLVYVPGSSVAAARTGLPVCVAGVPASTPTIAFDHEWGSFGLDRSPGNIYPTTLVATRVTNRQADVIISAAQHATFPAASAVAGTVTDIDMLASSTDTALVGRYVSLRDVQIGIVGSQPGFWVASDNGDLFVLPADEVHPRPGQRVNLKGVVLQLPDGMTNRLGDYRAGRDEVIYLYASQFRTL